MSVHSKFESQLYFRQLGFSIKIPDAGKSLKPFDYVVGIPVMVCNKRLIKFVAIEAKKANGWHLSRSTWQAHQRTALDIVARMSEDSAWVAIGFLDIPSMKLDYNRQPITSKLKKEAFLVRWHDYLTIEGEVSCAYKDIIATYSEYRMTWGKIGNRWAWLVPDVHQIRAGMQ